jgi:hypothetical protein
VKLIGVEQNKLFWADEMPPSLAEYKERSDGSLWYWDVSNCSDEHNHELRIGGSSSAMMTMPSTTVWPDVSMDVASANSSPVQGYATPPVYHVQDQNLDPVQFAKANVASGNMAAPLEDGRMVYYGTKRPDLTVLEPDMTTELLCSGFNLQIVHQWTDGGRTMMW